MCCSKVIPALLRYVTFKRICRTATRPLLSPISATKHRVARRNTRDSTYIIVRRSTTWLLRSYPLRKRFRQRYPNVLRRSRSNPTTVIRACCQIPKSASARPSMVAVCPAYSLPAAIPAQLLMLPIHPRWMRQTTRPRLDCLGVKNLRYTAHTLNWQLQVSGRSFCWNETRKAISEGLQGRTVAREILEGMNQNFNEANCVKIDSSLFSRGHSS